MAAHAVLEVANAFPQVTRLNARWIVLVAAITRILLEVRCRVARLTWDTAAPAMIQREGMIELRALPRLRGMALRTVGAEGAQMLLRFRVTTDARLRRAFEDVVGVTLSAGHVDVRARQLECGQTVIELRILPVRRSVTLRAARPECALVVIILLMAGDAILRRALEDVVHVALCALDRLVFADEFERRQVVIELRILPARWSVALRAVRSERAIVRIVHLVAIDTAC